MSTNPSDFLQSVQSESRVPMGRRSYAHAGVHLFKVLSCKLRQKRDSDQGHLHVFCVNKQGRVANLSLAIGNVRYRGGGDFLQVVNPENKELKFELLDPKEGSNPDYDIYSLDGLNGKFFKADVERQEAEGFRGFYATIRVMHPDWVKIAQPEVQDDQDNNEEKA